MKNSNRMQASQKIQFFIVSSSFYVLVLLPFVHSSQEPARVSISQGSNEDNIEKLSPQLSFEITLHGFLLWASMGFLMPVGILVIRMSNTEKCQKKLKVLFYFHVILQILSVLLATAAAIMSIKNFENNFNNKHRKIGAALYAIIWLQALIGFRRPQRGTKRRVMWFFLHWILGTGVSILGIINTYTGLQAYHTKTSKSVGLWTLLLTAEVCFIAFLYLFQEKWVYMKKQGVVLGTEQITPTDQVVTPKDNKKDLNYFFQEAS